MGHFMNSLSDINRRKVRTYDTHNVQRTICHAFSIENELFEETTDFVNEKIRR